MKKLQQLTIFLSLVICFAMLYSQETTSTNLTNDNDSLSNNLANNTNTITNGFLDDYYLGTDDETSTIEAESPITTLIRIMLITGILAFLTWVIIRFFFKRNMLSISTEGKSIEILATIPAGLGSYFLVAKLHTIYYLFSLSTDGLRLLDKITDQEAIDFIELNKVQTMPHDMQFVDLLDNLPEGKPKQALEFLREKIDHLRKK